VPRGLAGEPWIAEELAGGFRDWQCPVVTLELEHMGNGEGHQ